jgi:hypothetical protein
MAHDNFKQDNKGNLDYAEKTNSTRFGTNSRSPHSPENLKNSSIGVAIPINMDLSKSSIQKMTTEPD